MNIFKFSAKFFNIKPMSIFSYTSGTARTCRHGDVGLSDSQSTTLVD